MQIVLLPGMDGTGILFEPLLKELPNDIKVQVINYLCGKKQNYSQLIEYVKEKLPKEKAFVLVAESFSGPIGYAIASSPPDNLKSVVFVSTFISPPNATLWLVSKLPLALFLKIPIPLPIIKWFMLGKNIESHIISLFRKSLKMVKTGILAHRIKEMAKLRGGGKRIGVKCVYIAAKNDKLISYRHVEEFRILAPNIEVVEIAGPHFIMQAKPKESAQVLKNLIANRKAGYVDPIDGSL
jgi:pimeloyl-ACP methyl ester carboxylesterase